MQNRRLVVVGALSIGLLGASTLTACGHLPVTSQDEVGTHQSSAGNMAYANGTMTLKVRLNQQVAYGLQAMTPYTKASINHMVVKVFELVDGNPVPVMGSNNLPVEADLLNSELDGTIAFSNLKLGTTYRILCEAYKAPGRAFADLISTQDARSYVDVMVTPATQNSVVSLKAQLIDVVGTGDTSGNIVITDGQVLTSGPVGITVTAPAPTPTPPATVAPAPATAVMASATFDPGSYESTVHVTWNYNEDGTVDSYLVELYRHEQYIPSSFSPADDVVNLPLSASPAHQYTFRWTDYSSLMVGGGHVRVYAVKNGVRSGVSYVNF